jgi:hypothetical protein
MKRYGIAVLAVAVALSSSVHAQQQPKTAAEMAAEQAEAVARAQQKVAAEAEQARRDEQIRREREAQERRGRVIPLDIEIVISRYQGDKKVSSLPYELTVNAIYQYVDRLDNAPLTSLRMGGQVPLPTMAPVLGPDGKPLSGLPQGGGPVQYKDVGTYIDARGRWLDSTPGSFEVSISVQEDAVATPQGAPATALPVIRTFRASNNLVLRDGQTRQFTAGADRITGEVVKVDVTLKVAK